MSTPKRIQRRRTKGWRMPDEARYVGRPSRWGNPFRILAGHHLAGPSWTLARDTWGHFPADRCDAVYVSSTRTFTAADTVPLFRTLLAVRLRDEPDRLRAWLAPLVGHDLACWCPLGQPCHADVLLTAANGGTVGPAVDLFVRPGAD